MTDEESETWLIDAGDRVIEKMTVLEYSSLPSLERLIYCLWAADYGMRNAGDLDVVEDLHPTYQRDGLLAAQELGLPHASAAFSLTPGDLERAYLRIFNDVVHEIRAVSDGIG